MQLCLILIGCATWALASSTQCVQSCLDVAFIKNAECAGSIWACACQFHEQPEANACLTQCGEDRAWLNAACANGAPIHQRQSALKMIRRAHLPVVRTSSVTSVGGIETPTSTSVSSTSSGPSTTSLSSTVTVTVTASASTSTSSTPSVTSTSTKTSASSTGSHTTSTSSSSSISTPVASTPPTSTVPLPPSSSNSSVPVTTLTEISLPPTPTSTVASGSIQQLPTGGGISSGEKETRVQALFWFLGMAVAGLMV